MKIYWFPVLLVIVLALAWSYVPADEGLPFTCTETHCTMKREDFNKLMNALIWMDGKIDELRQKTGCT